jgi:two-component system response regulator AtoC
VTERARPASTLSTAEQPSDGASLDGWLEGAEKQRILQALAHCDGVQAHAARRLGISERSLWYRIRKLNIRLDRVARDDA